jgi:hypothetical protein
MEFLLDAARCEIFEFFVPQVACANSGLPRLERFVYLIEFPRPNPGVEMPVSAISFYRGGTVENVTPLAKKMKAVLLKYGAVYQVSRFQTGQNVGEWMVVVQYADWMAYAKAQDSFAQMPNTGK